MTIVHPPRTDENADTIEALEWAPPCEYSKHHLYGSGEAQWVVFFKPQFPCGCTRGPAFVLWCDGCLTRRSHLILCPRCYGALPLSAYIRRVEHV